MKRQRGRGRKPSGHQPNRNFESTGPDVKIRGSASHVYEKYMQLARDAASSGDRVMAENYLQHAEHYFRILKAMQPAHVAPQFEQRFDQAYDVDAEEGEDGDHGEGEMDGDQPGAEMHAHAPEQRRDHRDHRERREPREPREPREAREQREPREAREPREPREMQERSEGGDEEGGRNRRRRRSRFRTDGPGEGGPRGPRAEAEAPQPVEGFGQSLPAFLGGD